MGKRIPDRCLPQPEHSKNDCSSLSLALHFALTVVPLTIKLEYGKSDPSVEMAELIESRREQKTQAP